MHKRKLTFGFAVVCIALTILAQPANSQISKLLGGTKTNTDFIPGDAIAAAVAFPKQIGEDPKFDMLPREVITAWGKKELGFDPMLITQITFVVNEMESLQQPPQWAAILHFDEMQGLAGNTIDDLEERNVEGKTLFSGASIGSPSFLVYDEATMFVGDEEMFAGMIKSDKKGRVASLVRRGSVQGQVRAFGDIATFRPIINQMLQGIPAMLPPPITKLKMIPDQVEAIEIGLTVDGALKTQVVLHGADADAAEDIAKIISKALEFGADMGVGMLATQMDFDDPVQEATVEYVERFAEYFVDSAKPKVEGSIVRMHLKQEVTILPFLVGMALPAVQQARTAARRTQSMNNSRQMSLALHNYHSVHGKLPAQASYDKNGKPLLSWRVHILPYIEQQALYEQFHLDEPWDSPHNKKLISKMPHIYSSPSVASGQQGRTVYLGVAGKGMAFSEQPLDFAEFRDGTSNTVWSVEVDESHAVPWSKPQDWSPDERDPFAGLGHVNPGGFIASMADGSTQFLSSSTDPETWKAMLTTSGGEAPNINK